MNFYNQFHSVRCLDWHFKISNIWSEIWQAFCGINAPCDGILFVLPSVFFLLAPLVCVPASLTLFHVLLIPSVPLLLHHQHLDGSCLNWKVMCNQKKNCQRWYCSHDSRLGSRNCFHLQSNLKYLLIGNMKAKSCILWQLKYLSSCWNFDLCCPNWLILLWNSCASHLVKQKFGSRIFE